MANINPKGIDLTTGQSRLLTSSDTLTDASGSPVASGGLPKYYIEGCEVEARSNDSTWHVRVGSCRNVANTADIVVTSELSGDYTTGHDGSGLGQINGLDESGLDVRTSPITCSQSGTTITTTASIVDNGTGTFTPFLPRTVVNASTSGTAVTGAAGSKFTENLFPGDLFGNASLGWSRIIVVTSDTSATLVAALPGGDMSSAAWSVIHNATIWAGTTATSKQRINTINAAGTTVVGTVSETLGASSPLTLGVPAELQDFWLAVWVIDNGTTVATYISTQHEKLLAPPSAAYAASKRRVGWAHFSNSWDDEGSEGLYSLYYENAGHRRFAEYTHLLNETISLYGGATYTTYSMTAIVPREANHALISYETYRTAAGSSVFQMRARGHDGAGEKSSPLRLTLRNITESTGTLILPLDNAAGYQVQHSGTNDNINGTCYGFIDKLLGGDLVEA